MKHLRLLVCSVLLGSSAAFAASAPSNTAPSTQSTSNYTNTWEQSRIESTTSYAPYYSSPSSFGGYHSGWSNNYWGPTTHTRYVRVLNIRFPQDPIILAQWLPQVPSGVKPSSSVVAQMKPYLSDRFYPALSALIHDESLSNKRLQRISDYRAEKQRLLVELRTRIEEIRKAEPAARAGLYAELASSQSAALLAVEAKEEEIRKDLTGGGLFTNTVDWNETRSWRLGDDSRYESYNDEYQVMRASVFFQNGLSTPQRDLLREVSMELLKRGQDPTADIGLDSTGPYFYFSPATSRIRLPLDMPEALRTKIQEYRDLKDALKQEIRNTVYRLDRAWLDSTRVKALKELATQQEPRIAEMERLAEEIRHGLSTLKYPDEPAQSALTADLANQISGYLQAKVELQRNLRNRLTEARAVLPKDRIEIIAMKGGYGIEIVAHRGSTAALNAKREELRAQLVSFNSEQSKRFEALAIQKEKLRLQLKQLATSASSDARSVEQMLAEFSRSFAKQEMWNRYKDYRTAVLEPGLSPEQRRLLYGAAIETLMADYAY